MELRHRGPFRRSKKADVPEVIDFWICEGLRKRHVEGSRAVSLEALLREWDMVDVTERDGVHFLNESTGVEVAKDAPLDSHVNSKDVVRICTHDELQQLLKKFADTSGEMASEFLSPSKATTPLGSALSKLKRMGSNNPAIKRLQKTFDDAQGLHDEEAELLERFPEIDPVFESGEVSELSEEEMNAATNSDSSVTNAAMKCDVCDVSWPDDAADGRMYRHKRLGIVTHHGCTQFASDVLNTYPEISTRSQFVGSSSLSQLNRPGTFYVTVFRAMDLPGAQLLGTQVPYAKLSLLPWKEPSVTKPAENSGHNPMWKSMHDNMMTFSHMYNSTITPIPLLEVEIWNSNYISDDLIACTLLDMTPLLRFPNLEAKRWFTLSSRVQAPLIRRYHPSVGHPRVLLGIKFIPHEGEITTGNEHKFRVHQLKSVGLAIPNCEVCDRVIVNVLKAVWGYRCELCGIDVHKGCIMKAMVKCECKRLQRSRSMDRKAITRDGSFESDDETIGNNRFIDKPAVTVQRGGLSFKVLNDETMFEVGSLFVDFEGLHLCTKQCNQETNLHAKNIFEGDTYCRLTLDGVLHETSPVLKSADPMYMERICIKTRHRNSVFKIEVIDFNTDTCISEMSATLFELLQRDADEFVHSNRFLQKLRIPLQHLNLEVETNAECAPGIDGLSEFPQLSTQERFSLLPPGDTKGSSTNAKRMGFAVIALSYVESKRDLLRIPRDGELRVRDSEEPEFSVESLKSTIDRLGRTIKLVQWVDAEYNDIIAWKHKRKSAFFFVVFVASCLWVDAEYIGAYILTGVIIYMIYQMHLRLDGNFEKRWIGFTEYNEQQADRLKLHRPIADLFVVVHEATLSETTDRLLVASQTALKEIATSKPTVYVRIKYLPNDKTRSELGGDAIFLPLPFSETIVGWTHAVDRSRIPVWGRSRYSSDEAKSIGSQSVSAVSSSPPALHEAASVLQKQKKAYPFRNFSFSWRHNAHFCSCARCTAWRDESSSTTDDESSETCGIDHNALYFPIPQACRKTFSGRADVAPWKIFPGLLQFELCLSLTGDARATPDLVIATGRVPLRDVRSTANSTQEMTIPLTAQFALANTSELTPLDDLPPVERPERDELFVRVELVTPETSVAKDAERNVMGDTIPHRRLSGKSSTTISHAERVHSELVCESMVYKEKTAVIGHQIFDALSKVKGTITTLQMEIDQACGIVASVENLFNWTHPWKSAVIFAGLIVGVVVLSLIKGRWIVLLFGLTEFGAVFLDDLPPSNQIRHMLWNLLTSLPTDQDLIDAYDGIRAVYNAKMRSEKEKEAHEIVILRHHALWAGTVLSKAENDRHFKSWFVVYRPYRFVMWKSVEDAESGAPPYQQLLFERMDSIVSSQKVDEKAFIFHVFGSTNSGIDEKRSFSFESEALRRELLDIVRGSCEIRA